MSEAAALRRRRCSGANGGAVDQLRRAWALMAGINSPLSRDRRGYLRKLLWLVAV